MGVFFSEHSVVKLQLKNILNNEHTGITVAYYFKDLLEHKFDADLCITVLVDWAHVKQIVAICKQRFA